MERPGAGIIRVVLQDNVSRVRGTTTWNQLGIAALCVLRVRDLTVPGSETFGEDLEVVAVEMHRVGSYELVVDHEAHGGVCAKVVDLPIGIRVGEITRIREREDRVAGEKVSCRYGKMD